MQQQKPLISHFEYLMALDKSKDLDSIGYYLSEHLRVAGGYWTLNALSCLNKLNYITSEKKTQLCEWLKGCQNTDGGFGGNTHHDSHITNTHYALLTSLLLEFPIDYEAAANYIAQRQKPDGSFEGDCWGEIDARFSYCALSAMTLMGRRDKIDIKKAAQYIKKCRNFDGSFGGQPDAESHGAYVFCCVGSLYLCDEIQFNIDELAMWIHERQTLKGGLNGRPEKLADVCYSWWMYSALCILKRERWINQKALEEYILECQDTEGGIADRPGNQVDVFHTFFGLAALSLLNTREYGLQAIDPVFALPRSVLENIEGVKKFLIELGNQRVVLPQIQQQQQQKNNETYNFVQKKKPLQQSEDFEDWRKKCEDLQKDVETRNHTIYSIQRNFESLSALLKNEKSENAHIREEVGKLRESNQQLLVSEKDLNNKLIDQQRKLKEMTNQLEQCAEQGKQNSKLQQEIQLLKLKITENERIIEQQMQEIQKLVGQVNLLKQSIGKVSLLEDQSNSLSQQVKQLQSNEQAMQQALQDKDINLQLAFQNVTQLTKLIEALKSDQQSTLAQLKTQKQQENGYQQEIINFKQEKQTLLQQLQKLTEQIANQHTMIMMKEQQEHPQKSLIQQLQIEVVKKQNALDEKQIQLQAVQELNSKLEQENKSSAINCQRSQQMVQELQICKDKLDLSQQQNCDLMQQQQNSIKQMTQLQSEVENYKQQGQQEQLAIKQLQLELSKHRDSLNMSNQEKQSQLTDINEQLKQQYAREQMYQEQVSKQSKQLQYYAKYDSIIAECQKYPNGVTVVGLQEYQDTKQNCINALNSNTLLQQELNEKIVELESMSLRCKSIQSAEQSLTSMQMKYQELKQQYQLSSEQLAQSNKENRERQIQLEAMQQDLSVSNKENRNLAGQIQQTMDNLQNYTQKNTHLQKEFKDKSDQLYKLELESKQMSIKYKQLQAELETLNPDKMREFQQTLEKKEKEFISQLKNIQLATDAQIISISCGSCMEILKQTITCYPCGHSCCQSCFKQECPTCGNNDGYYRNKQMDDLISKISYSKQILNTYKII